jgi:hypothetical protein
MSVEEHPRSAVPGGEGKRSRPEAGKQPAAGGATRWLVFLGGCLLLFVLILIAGIQWSREHALTSECCRRFELLGKAAEEYAGKNGGKYPYEPRALEYMLVNNLRHRKFLVCPKSKRTYRWTRHERSRQDAPHTLLAWEEPNMPPHGLVFKGYHALFVGARVKLLSREELLRRLQEERRTPPTPYRRPKKPRPGMSARSSEKLPGYPPRPPSHVKLHPSSQPPETAVPNKPNN